MAAAPPEKFFEGDTPHGLVKRIIYKKYLQAYVAKTQRSGLKTIIIDGFAGAGRYGNTWPIDIEKYGSPMIALLVALQFLYYVCKRLSIPWLFNMYMSESLEWDQLQGDMVRTIQEESEAIIPFLPGYGCSKKKMSRKMYLYFIEKDGECFTQLVKCVKTYLYIFLRQLGIYNHLKFEQGTNHGYETVDFYITHKDFPLECHISNCEFKDFKPPQMPEWSRRLTFLDPFGYSDTPMEQVRKYVDDHSEVFINFMSHQVNDAIKNIAALYGIPLRQFVLNIIRMGENTPATNAKNCSRSYIEHIKEYTGAEYALMFEIRGRKNAVIYHLIHFTHHRKGLEAMKESMNTCSQYEGTFKMSDYRIVCEGIALTIGNQQDDAIVAEDVYREFRGKQGVPIGDVETFVWEHSPYVYRKKILKILETSDPPRLISVVNEDTEEERVRRRNTYPDWGKWLLTFADEDFEDVLSGLKALKL